MTVIILNGKYKGCECDCYKLGLDWYFQDDEKNCKVPLKYYKYKKID